MIYDLELKAIVLAKYDGQSVIDYLTDRFTYKSREKWLELISLGKIRVNGEIVESSFSLKENSVLTFLVNNYYEADLDCNYHLVFENENIIVVSKPANLPVSSNHRFFRQNMTALIRRDFNLPDINPIHRLDRETSGLIIYLKKRFDKPRYLRKDSRLIMKDKYYLAIVRGEVDENSFTINVPLKESNVPPIGYKTIVAENNDGKPASTDFLKLATANGYSLLLAKLNSGRKHQIRAHCAYAGFPIVGDKLYSFDGKYYLKLYSNEEFSEDDYRELGARHQLLHSYAMNLELPDEGKKFIVSEYFSQEFERYLCLFANSNFCCTENLKEYIKNIIFLGEKI